MIMMIIMVMMMMAMAIVMKMTMAIFILCTNGGDANTAGRSDGGPPRGDAGVTSLIP